MKQVRFGTSILLAALLLLGSLTTILSVSAAETLPAVPLEGAGTEESPYIIADAEDLLALAVFINTGNAAATEEEPGYNSFYGYYFKQTADIDLQGVAWEPIGYSGDYYFSGHYDGGNYTISNALCTGKEDTVGDKAYELGFATAGIFGWVAFGSVKNVHVKDSDFSATGNQNYSYVGGLASVAYAAEITNCTVTNTKVQSMRQPSNNNCAGGIVGYSTGGRFESCASTDNTIIAQVYGGGFVGEIDDDYGVGDSSFTNCYVARSSVTIKSTDPQDTNTAGGFAGELTNGTLTVTNCYLFDVAIAIDPDSVGSPKQIGVWAGSLWGSGTAISATNCYYDDCGTVTENVGASTLKLDSEFADGAVAALLGSGYVNGQSYPLLASTPADYSRVNAALKKAETLDGTIWDKTEVDAAVSSVITGKNIGDQAEVDAMADALEAAIKEWEVRAEIVTLKQSVEKLKADLATATSELEDAIAAGVSPAELQEAVDQLTDAYEAADTALTSLMQTEIDQDVKTMEEALRGELTNAQSKLQEAVDALQANLEKALDDMDQAVQDQDQSLTDKITALEEAYQAADILIHAAVDLLGDEDDALAASMTKLEETLKSADAELKTTVETMQADLGTAKTDLEALKADLEAAKTDLEEANTTQWILVIAVGVLALGNTVALVLLFVRKKKEA